MTLASRCRRSSYAEVATPKRNGSVTNDSNKSNVKVVVRIRPENTNEKNGNYRIVVRAMNEHVLVFDPNEQSSPEYGYKRRHARRDIRRRQNKDLKFAFDYVFDPSSANHEIYHQTTKKVLDSFLEGYNCSVFAYGATGAGKTHTMLGNSEKPGVMYLTMMDLYNRIGAMEGDRTCDVAVSYLEVYNEQIRDLLMGGKTLPVREDSQNGVVVPGLSLHKPRDAEELLHMLHYGNQNRTQHPTDANAESSRSHAVFQVFVRQKDRTANISAEVKVAKLCLVDLAGSERATVTKNRGNRFREGANINRSLLALGNVINALADPKYKGHVPYRDSKLTRLLKDSLGGNCQTVMIAAVSPSSMTYEDTYNTLKYADRAKNIQSTLKKNVLNVDFHVARYGQIVEELRKEILELKEKLRFYEEGKLVKTVSQTSSIEVCRMKEKLDGVFCTRLKLSREFLDAELKSRDLEWKIHRKEKCLSRMEIVCDNNTKLSEKLKKMVMLSRHTLDGFHSNRDKCTKSLLDNKKSVAEMEESIKVHCNRSGDNLETESLKLTLQVHQTSMALTESQYCVKYLTKVVKTQEREIQSSERMIGSLLHLVRQQHLIIKGSNMLTSDLEEEYQQMKNMAEGREVSFADQTFSGGNQSFSVSGLLDFRCLPSDRIVNPDDSKVSESVLVHHHAENRASHSKASKMVHTSNKMALSKSLNLESIWTNNNQNPVSKPSIDTDAGHTPFPNKIVTKDDVAYCTENNSIQPSQAKDLPIQNVTNLTSPPCQANSLEYSRPLDSHPFAQLTQRCIENKTVNLLKKTETSLKSKPSQSMDSTFTLEENTSDEQNSTFTLMETCDKDPEILARTPVIEDKFSQNSHKDVESVSSGMPNIDVLTRQVLTSVDVCIPDSHIATDKFVTKPSHGCDSATSVPCMLSHNSLGQLVSHEQIFNNQTQQKLTALDSGNCSNIMQPHLNDILNNSVTENFAHSSRAQQTLSNVLPTQNQLSVNTLKTRSNESSSHASSVITSNTPTAPVLKSRTVTKASNNEMESQESSKVLLNGSLMEGKSHAVRSITFGGFPSTPDSLKQGRSYADVVQSPSVVRTPLREMNSNTPLSEQNQRPGAAGKLMMKKENLFGDNSQEETSRKLQEMGLPSLMERWHTDPRKPKRDNQMKPSYMQPTKAARNRNKSKLVNNENMEPTRVPVQPTNKNRGFKRSQSVSSVNKPGWQI